MRAGALDAGADAVTNLWATTQNNLGLAQQNLPTGDRRENLKNAIACFRNALRVYTQKSFPRKHKLASENLALALAELQSL